RVVLGYGSLTRASGVDGDGEAPGQRVKLGRRIGPEDAVAGDEERTTRGSEGLERPVDRRRIACASQGVRRIDARAPALPRDIVLPVEDVGRYLEERRAWRRAHRLAESHPQIDL